jgi:hypothetical protein
MALSNTPETLAITAPFLQQSQRFALIWMPPEVSPFEGGWSIKLCDTGEVLFFETGGQAERKARRLAAKHLGGARVRVLDLRRQLAGVDVRPPLQRHRGNPNMDAESIDHDTAKLEWRSATLFLWR